MKNQFCAEIFKNSAEYNIWK